MNMNFVSSIRKCSPSLLFKCYLAALLLVLNACQNDDSPEISGSVLHITANIDNPSSRAMNTNTSFVNGDGVGVMVKDAMNEQYLDYSHLQFTYDLNGTGEWQCDKTVLLMDAKATLYGYYPYQNNCDMTAIQVDMTAADQTDWMYATPVNRVNKDNADINMTFNHMLANIRLVIEKGTYTGNGNITSVSLTSDGLASKGIFNAAQATPGYTSMEGAGEEFVRSVSAVAGGTPLDIMVIPTGVEASIDIYITVDGVEYVAQTSAVTLESGYNYQYTLRLNDGSVSL